MVHTYLYEFSEIYLRISLRLLATITKICKRKTIRGQYYYISLLFNVQKRNETVKRQYMLRNNCATAE